MGNLGESARQRLLLLGISALVRPNKPSVEKLTAYDQAQHTGLLRDEHPAVGQEGDRSRLGQAYHHVRLR